MPPLNLHKTQSGYVPLEDRFKSFPKDWENSPDSDKEFYFDNYANGTLEKATLDLLYPTPQWLKDKLYNQRNPTLFSSFRLTDEGLKRVTSDGAYRVAIGED